MGKSGGVIGSITTNPAVLVISPTHLHPARITPVPLQHGFREAEKTLRGECVIF
jgi:hypothetical protein